MPDWSKLPYDIVGAIVLKFDAIKDFVRFSAVCSSWKRACLQVKHLCQPTTPWLMLAERTKDNPYCLRKLFDLHTNTCLELKLSQTYGRRCWGSNYGWIVTVGLDRQMHLFNPLTKARLCLPCQLTLPNQPPDNGTLEDDEWFRLWYFTRAIVLRVPDEGEEFVVMVVYGEWFDLAFARPGDKIWTPIDLYKEKFDIDIFRETHGVSDVCHYDGNILILLGNGAIGYCDISSSHPRFIDYLPAPRGLFDTTGRNKVYLVNSSGDLLIVLRNRVEVRPDEVYYQTLGFVVFTPNFDTQEWVEVKDLGDNALFVGDNCSVAVRAPRFQCNHIYFTDDEYEFWKQPTEYGGHDMGAYNIKNKEIAPYYEGGDFRSKICTPFWFTPQF